MAFQRRNGVENAVHEDSNHATVSGTGVLPKTKRNASFPVVDLVSSDDEDKDGNRAAKPPMPKRKRKRGERCAMAGSARDSSNELFAAGDVIVLDLDGDSDQGSKSTRNTIEPSDSFKQKQKRARKAPVTVAAPTAFAAQLPVVLEGGHPQDDAILTHNLLEIIANMADDYMWTCSFACHSMVHVQQRDKWSCGFRNMQMLLGALLPLLPAHHAYFAKSPSRAHASAVLPSVSHLQRWIRQSWQEGYDTRGAQHFRYQDPKRIGAVEVASILTYSGVDATVLQFVACPASRRLLAPVVFSYFCNRACVCKAAGGSQNGSYRLATRVLQHAETIDKTHTAGEVQSCGCLRLPLYLQWPGHSVTIVGIRHNKPSTGDHKFKPSDYALLVFDPAKHGAELIQNAFETATTERMEISFQSLMRKDVQLVLATTNGISATQQQARRLQVSLVTAAADEVTKVNSRKKLW